MIIITTTLTTYTLIISTIVITDHRESIIGGLDYLTLNASPHRQKPPLCSATGGLVLLAVWVVFVVVWSSIITNIPIERITNEILFPV